MIPPGSSIRYHMQQSSTVDHILTIACITSTPSFYYTNRIDYWLSQFHIHFHLHCCTEWWCTIDNKNNLVCYKDNYIYWNTSFQNVYRRTIPICWIGLWVGHRSTLWQNGVVTSMWMLRHKHGCCLEQTCSLAMPFEAIYNPSHGWGTPLIT